MGKLQWIHIVFVILTSKEILFILNGNFIFLVIVDVFLSDGAISAGEEKLIIGSAAPFKVQIGLTRDVRNFNRNVEIFLTTDLKMVHREFLKINDSYFRNSEF